MKKYFPAKVGKWHHMTKSEKIIYLKNLTNQILQKLEFEWKMIIFYGKMWPIKRNISVKSEGLVSQKLILGD